MFYIKNIKINTANDVTSTLSLTSGLNIVYGPSNTGKSLILDCIDFLMGSKGKNDERKNEESVSYKRLSKPGLKIKSISLCLHTDDGEITLSRDIDKDEINVASNVYYVESGTYTIGGGSKKTPPINKLWLRLLGITADDIKVARKTDGSPQGLTLRTFRHVFMIGEARIVGENSILKNGQGYTKNIPIPTISSLIYLATGKSFAILKEDQESEAVVSARKTAARMMYDCSVTALAERNFVESIEADDDRSIAEINEDINGLLARIGAAENELDRAVEDSRKLADAISDIDDQLTECSMLKDRYASLRTQYESDIRRLTFITEGEIQSSKIIKRDNCPFCGGVLQKKQSESCVEAAISEVAKIELKINDLREADGDIDREAEELNGRRIQLVDERKKIQGIIRAELQPQVDELRSVMGSYTVALQKAKAKEMVAAFADILREQFEIITSNEEEPKKEAHDFDIDDQMEQYITIPLSMLLEKILRECNYRNFVGARFDRSLCDVVVNGAEKMSQGKGFRAFLNAVMAIAVQEWLDDHDLYRTGLLVMDSPILSLKEREENIGTERTTSRMRDGLFQYMVNHQGNRQTIILENEVPKGVDYTDTNFIHFTKTEGEGIYGLIIDYRE